MQESIDLLSPIKELLIIIINIINKYYNKKYS